MQRHFEDGVYWDPSPEVCDEISRTAIVRGAARFRGNTVTHIILNHQKFDLGGLEKHYVLGINVLRLWKHLW